MDTAIHIPAGTTIRYEALSFNTVADAEMTVHVIEERNGFTKALDADGDILYVRTKALPGRDSSLYPHPDAPCWGCKTIAEADKKLEAIKDHHYHTPTRQRDHHAYNRAVLCHRNTVARLNDTTNNQPACTATEDEVSIDADDLSDADNSWTTDPDEIGRTLGIPAPVILPAPPAPAPTERSTQPKEVAVAHTPAKTPKAVVPSVDPISFRYFNNEHGHKVIIPSFDPKGERGPYSVELAWGMDDVPEPVSCTCTHYCKRIAPRVRRSLRSNAEAVPSCKHMDAVRVALVKGLVDGVTLYRLVALAA